MFRYFFAMMLFATAYSASAVAGPYTFCLMTNQVAGAGKLKGFSDKQIKNGLCVTTKEIMTAMATGDSFKQKICGVSAKYMMQEFKKRFPKLSSRSVVGRC